jgi:dTDP-4-dehydrorhamnose reductase
MSNRGKFLLLGASGLLGRHMRSLLDPKRTVSTYRSHPVEGSVYFDATSMRARDVFLRGSHGFQAAYILYGITNLEDCARNPEATARVNVDSIDEVIDDLDEAGVKTIFASSDAVFDGSPGLKTETAPTHPVLTYGKQKLAVERHLATKKGAWVIARLSKLMSTRSESRNLLNEWAEQLDRGESIRCARDVVFSPADVGDAARAMVRMADESLAGIYHVCGPQAVNRLDLLQLLLEKAVAYKPFNPRISTCSIRDFPFLEPRPLDASMDPAKLYAALGSRFRGVDAVCAEFAANRYGRLAARGVRPAHDLHSDSA